MAKSQVFTPANEAEQLIALKDVPALPWLPLRRRGAKLNVSTLYRWISSGSEGVRLKAVRVGSVWCTRADWLQCFFEESAAAALRLKPPTDNAAQRQAERQLQRVGAM
jgi:hypothetical protein